MAGYSFDLQTALAMLKFIIHVNKDQIELFKEKQRAGGRKVKTTREGQRAASIINPYSQTDRQTTKEDQYQANDMHVQRG